MDIKDFIKRAEKAKQLAYGKPAERIYEMCELIPTEDKNIFKLVFIKDNIKEGRVRIKDLLHFLEKRKFEADIRVPSVSRYNLTIAPTIIEYRTTNSRIYCLDGNYYPFEVHSNNIGDAIILDYDREVHLIDGMFKITINKCINSCNNIYLLSATINNGFAIIAASSEKEALAKASYIEDNKYQFAFPVKLDNVYGNLSSGIITYQIYK